jgi:hypothetical protein
MIGRSDEIASKITSGEPSTLARLIYKLDFL